MIFWLKTASATFASIFSKRQQSQSAVTLSAESALKRLSRDNTVALCASTNYKRQIWTETFSWKIL